MVSQQARPEKSNHRGAIEILRGAGHEKAVSSIEQRASPTYVDAWVHSCHGKSWAIIKTVGLVMWPWGREDVRCRGYRIFFFLMCKFLSS